MEEVYGGVQLDIGYASFYDLVQRVEKLSDEARFYVEGDKLFVKQMDPSQCQMLSEEIEVTRSVSVAERADYFFDLNVKTLVAFLDKPSKTEMGKPVSLVFKAEGDVVKHLRVKIRVPSGADFDLFLLQNADFGSPKEPKVGYAMELGVNRNEIVKALKKCAVLSSHTVFEVDYRDYLPKIVISSIGSAGNCVVPFNTKDNNISVADGVAQAKVMIPTEYLLEILQVFPAGQIRVFLKTDSPIRLEARDGKLKYWLAPRVEA